MKKYFGEWSKLGRNQEEWGQYVWSFAVLSGGLVKYVIVYLLSVIIYSGEEKQMLVIYILSYEIYISVFVFILIILTEWDSSVSP